MFADEDATWPRTTLPYVLAPFEDQRVGGVGASQRVRPMGERITAWEVLAAFRLTIRDIEISSSTRIDGGIPCLSGRTANGHSQGPGIFAWLYTGLLVGQVSIELLGRHHGDLGT